MELYHRRRWYSSPAVANGVVYFGSGDGNIYALNASTGAKLWSYTTGNPVDSSPAVANGVVYIGSDDGNVYALNASTGAKLWNFTTGSIVFLARSGEWGGLCRLADEQRVCAERQHRRHAVELCDGRRCEVLARSGEWGGLYRLRGRQLVCAERQHRRQLWSYTTGNASDVPRPRWRMGWFISAPMTATCMR